MSAIFISPTLFRAARRASVTPMCAPSCSARTATALPLYAKYLNYSFWICPLFLYHPLCISGSRACFSDSRVCTQLFCYTPASLRQTFELKLLKLSPIFLYHPLCIQGSQACFTNSRLCTQLFCYNPASLRQIFELKLFLCTCGLHTTLNRFMPIFIIYLFTGRFKLACKLEI